MIIEKVTDCILLKNLFIFCNQFFRTLRIYEGGADQFNTALPEYMLKRIGVEY